MNASELQISGPIFFNLEGDIMFLIYAGDRVTSPRLTDGDVLSTQVTYEGESSLFMLRVSLWDVDELLNSETRYLTDVEAVLALCLDSEYCIHEIHLITPPHINMSKRSKMNIVCQIHEAQQPCGVESEKTYVIVVENDDSYVISRTGTPRKYLCKETLLYQFDEETLLENNE